MLTVLIRMEVLTVPVEKAMLGMEETVIVSYAILQLIRLCRAVSK